MEWHESMDGQKFSLRDGSCMAVITRDVGLVWVAQLARMGVVIEHDSFEVLTDAQAWCLTRLNEFRAEGQCI